MILKIKIKKKYVQVDKSTKSHYNVRGRPTEPLLGMLNFGGYFKARGF
jgi:hypothetical protein